MNDELTTRLRDQLHEQADDVHGAPLTFESVRGRAHAIRRRRRLAAAGVAAVAVAAIAVPTALLGDQADRSDRPPEIAETPTRAAEPTPNPNATFPLTLDVPDGPVPATGYLAFDDQQLVTPDATLDLPGDFTQVAPYDGGWVGIRAGDLPPTGHQVVVLDEDLQEVSAVSSGPSLATSEDGSRVAWVEQATDGGWSLVDAPADGDGEPIRTEVPGGSAVEGFVAPELVVYSVTEETTGEVSFRTAGPRGWDFEDASMRGFQVLGGVSESAGLVAGQTEFHGDSTCSQARSTTALRGEVEVAWETCDHRLGEFSPDGQLLIGIASYADYGSPTLAMLDAATGKPVAEWTSGRRQQESAVVMAAAWEDADTLVAVVEQDAEQQVLRLDADGSVTRAGEPREAAMTIEYFLPQNSNRQ